MIKLTSIIVEDEILSRMYLKSLLQIWCSHVEVLAAAEDCDSAVSVIDALKPDLVFLDIALLNSTGFDVVKRLNTHYPKIIFTTAFGDHTLKIIKPSGLPFLQKPIDSDDLVAIINKTTAQSKDAHCLQLQHLLQTLLNENNPSSVYIETNEGAGVFVVLAEIIFIEAKGAECILYLAKGNELHINNHGLKECESFLSDRCFFRVSQKHIINKDFIEQFHENAGPYVLMKNKISIAVSLKKVTTLKNFLGAG